MYTKVIISFLAFFSGIAYASDNTPSPASITDVTKEQKYQHLPDVNINDYKAELLEYQKLQRKNLMLKLETENHNIEKTLRKSSKSDKDISLMAVLSSGGNGYVAKIYDGVLRNIRVGDIIYNQYKVTSINKDSIKVEDINNKEIKVYSLYERG
ncbi:hypothetical protein U9527_20085 [Escherichia coli]